MPVDNDIFIKKISLKENETEYVANIVLNRPGKYNALSKGVITQFVEFIKELDQDPMCRVVVVSGEGQHFCAGADLKWMKDSVNLSVDENFQEAQELQKLFSNYKSLNLIYILLIVEDVF